MERGVGMVRTKGTVALAVVTAWAFGCGASREAAWETTPDGEVRAPRTEEEISRKDQVLAEARAAWDERLDEEKLRVAIQRFEQAAELDPNDQEIWVALSRAYYFHADGHMSFDEARHDEMMETYEKGIQAGERSLVALSPDFAQRMRAGTRIEEAVAVLDARAVPALYWRSTNMGKWGIAKGFATILSYKDEIRAIMARCLELDATYYYYGPHRYFGAFYARVPAFAGGDLERSREHFESALEGAPGNLATRSLMAEHYAVKSQNRALFDEQLNAVLAADLGQLPADILPENTIEQRRARDLLAKAGELFE
jgi:tetratricopeptide (TPR) repeat protein